MTINNYGDKLIQAGKGHGADIAMQRPDELDLLSISECEYLCERGLNPTILDLGSGRGAQCNRLMNAGARIGIACDMEDFSADFESLPLNATNQPKQTKKFLVASFCDENLTSKLMQITNNTKFDIIVFQRAIHYLTYKEAMDCLKQISRLLNAPGKLYLSASGLTSELSENYKGLNVPVENRFDNLSIQMQDKHGIHSSVCLYKTNELVKLCQDSGFKILNAFESSFGNIKIVAQIEVLR